MYTCPAPDLKEMSPKVARSRPITSRFGSGAALLSQQPGSHPLVEGLHPKVQRAQPPCGAGATAGLTPSPSLPPMMCECLQGLAPVLSSFVTARFLALVAWPTQGRARLLATREATPQQVEHHHAWALSSSWSVCVGDM